MRLSRADVAALLIALGAAITGVVVWKHGTVDLGLTLRSGERQDLGLDPGIEGRAVVVYDVTPGGNADRSGFRPGEQILELATTDGSEVARGDPIGELSNKSEEFEIEASSNPAFGPVPLELHMFDADYRPPIEAVETARIGSAVAGAIYLEESERWIAVHSSINRSVLEFELNQSIWVAVVGLLLGVIAWRWMVHGLAGPSGQRHAVAVASAIAVPALILPAVQVGTPAGIAAGTLVPAAAALVLGLSIAHHHPERAWIHTGMAASVVLATMAAVLVVRSLTSPVLGSGDAGIVMVLVTATAAAPAAVAALAPGKGRRERASVLSLGLVPGAAAILNGSAPAEPIWPALLVSMLLAWYVLPFERAISLAGGVLSRVRSIAPAGPRAGADQPVAVHEPLVPASVRDALTVTLFGSVLLLGLSGLGSASYLVLSVMAAGMVGFAIQAGILGPSWADAAVPIGAAVGLPIAVAGYGPWAFGGAMGWASTSFALVGFSVAHALAARHSDPAIGQRLLLWSGGIVALTVLVSTVLGGGGDEPFDFLLASLVPLVPGIPVAFAADHDQPRAVSARLETLVVALTPAVAATVLTPLVLVPLAAWIIAIVVWRRFTLAPLLGLAQRTQLQRDLAVAAAETERARLAADLHDDALQQLTMLVRTLDEGGHTAEANEAREVATKLRSVVGDLRLPILDDLGAGAALEWLVERVEPMAGGPVKLERSDETRRPPPNVELAVFRVAQEALTNAIKHGRPPIAVHYDVRADGRVTLAVDDAGYGIGESAAEEAPRQGHFGLANMQQRAEQIGALLDVRRWPSGGTRVALEWRPR